MHTDRIKEKIRKLLALSEGAGATAGEIENAIDAATRLMAQHNLSRADIDHGQEGDSAVNRVQMGRSFAYSYGVNLTTWEGQLSIWVAKFVGYCDTYKEAARTVKKGGVIMRNPDGSAMKKSRVCFYGSDESAAAAAELFEDIRDTIVSMAFLRYNGYAKGNGAAYCMGFAMGLFDQLKGSQQRLENADEQTRSLIRVDRSNQVAVTNRARNWLAETHNVRLRTRSSSFSGYNDTAGAGARGRADGQNYSAGSRSPKGRRITA